MCILTFVALTFVWELQGRKTIWQSTSCFYSAVCKSFNGTFAIDFIDNCGLFKLEPSMCQQEFMLSKTEENTLLISYPL